MTNEEHNDAHRKSIEAQMKVLGIKNSSLVTGDEFTPTTFQPTGIVEIDSILGPGGGFPDGTCAELAGESQSGKTHVGLCTIAHAQNNRGRRCAFFNVENSFYTERAIALGVQVHNPDLFEMYEGIDTAEKYGDLLLYLVNTGNYGVIVVDSITALIPEAEVNKNLTDNPKVGVHALLIGRLVKKLVGACHDSGTTVILINQFRMGAGAIPGTMVKITTGGEGMTYLCHMRLWFHRIGGKAGDIIGDNDEIIGGKSKVDLIKTRYSKPRVQAIFPIYFEDSEVNPLGEFLYISQARGKEYIKVVKKKYIYADPSTGEVLAESKDPVEFAKQLITAPGPVIGKNRFDTAFNYICNKLKYNQAQIDVVLNSLEKDASSGIVAPSEIREIALGDEEAFGDDA
jgi:recombination protein RecA